jgi:hypothetical protein
VYSMSQEAIWSSVNINTKEAPQLSLASHRWPGPKNARCIGHSLQEWKGLHWTNWTFN